MNTEPTETKSNNDSTISSPEALEQEKQSESDHTMLEEGVHLPEPDRDNITVLTDKLPNKPILPWNRYNSPWDEAEEEVSLDSDKLEEEKKDAEEE